MKQLTKQTISILMALFMIVGLMSGVNLRTYAEEVTAPVTKAESQTVKAAADSYSVLAFTSDTHNKSDNTAANRLGSWVAKMKDMYGKVDYMSFGGDMANASASESDFWTLTQKDMDKLAEQGVNGVFTTGNHEYSPGSYTNGKNSTTQKYIEDQEAVNADNYRIYCLGSSAYSRQSSSGSGWGWGGGGWNTYDSTQIDALSDYLNSVGNDKPIFIITHYPLHTNGSRTITGASDIIDTLNAAADSGKKIIYLWGHNHTDSDKAYDQIYAPKDSLTYSSGNSKAIKFYYGAAGCMSDSEYGTGSASKG
jgi:hypothetical protein